MKTAILTLCKILIFVIVLMSVISHVVIANSATKKLQIGVKKRPGTLDDGTEFDSSIPRGNPLTFTLGSGQVIKGWDQGLMGMCEGEQRKLVIPPELAYGEAGAPPKIPKSATLTFHVDLVKIERKDEL
ncbi:Peptidyl-prolyl cis-trans isomerase [Operophtera brumata]|uniref:peptidylprolyl isomerase n=1 Tax=Operophtera brumata TaxID=104452 RepID=A0A0L7L7K5_OPEBR|nr:Peptidyl-prolyl cis-trans isomerase [Operophtera brumata]